MPETRPQREQILQLQRQVLQRIAISSPLRETLGELCDLVENLVPESYCTVMLLDPDSGQVHLDGYSACIPPEFIAKMGDKVPPDLAGSCGAAISRGEPVIVADTTTHPTWQPLRAIVDEFSIRSCWSYPFLGRGDFALGSFAISSATVREPDAFESDVLSTASHLAGIAVQGHWDEEERKQLQRQVQHRQKLESLGVLTGGIAHDFNNLTAVIRGNTDLARIDVQEGHAAHRRLDEIEKAANAAADLCREMLVYSGRAESEVGPVQLNDLIREASKLLEVVVSKRVRLDLDLMEDLPTVNGDPVQLRQVIMNLITNASEACEPAGGNVRLETGLQHFDRTYFRKCHINADLPEGEYAFLRVTDDGSGMDEETRGRIFDPFFSTKFTGRGLGLAATLGIVLAHDATIRVESEPGRGSTVTVLIPSLGEPSRRAESPRASREPWSGSGTILLVDDEPMIRRMGEGMLESLGFQPLLAEHGAQAIEVLGRANPRPKCILLDLVMPGLDGRQTFDALRRQSKNVPIVVLSGLGDQEVRARFEGRSVNGFLFKPFSLEDLRLKLREVLGGTSRAASAR